MSIATQKKICWLVLAMSAGWLLLIAIVCTQERISNREFLPTTIWSSICLIALIGSTIHLRRCYRIEPAPVLGHWHVSLVDIYVATFFAAFCMMLWRALWPDNFLFWGAALSIVAGIWLLIALLVAERRGFKRFITKVPMAFGLAFKSYGLMAIGAVLSICVFILFLEGPKELPRFLYEISGLKYLMGGNENFRAPWLPISMRLGMVSFIIGSIMTRLLRDKR